MNIHESAEDHLETIVKLREDHGMVRSEKIAQRIYGRHKLLTQVFIQLGVSPETAAADTCRVEHDLSDETFEKIKAHAAGGKDNIRVCLKNQESSGITYERKARNAGTGVVKWSVWNTSA